MTEAKWINETAGTSRVISKEMLRQLEPRLMRIVTAFLDRCEEGDNQSLRLLFDRTEGAVMRQIMAHVNSDNIERIIDGTESNDSP
jgi:hypothetical protein